MGEFSGEGRQLGLQLEGGCWVGRKCSHVLKPQLTHFQMKQGGTKFMWSDTTAKEGTLHYEWQASTHMTSAVCEMVCVDLLAP